MLFPKEEEYTEWFEKAGFVDVNVTRIGPKWYNGERKWGLIMGCSVTGVKPTVGGIRCWILVAVARYGLLINPIKGILA